MAKCLHEAFKLVHDDDDTSAIRQCFLTFILDSDRDIMLAMNQHLPVIMKSYCNNHTLNGFKGRTVCTNDSDSESTPS